MTNDELLNIEKIAKAATPGPRYTTLLSGDWSTPSIDLLSGGIIAQMTHYGKMREDAKFIVAASPPTVLSLINRIRELESDIEYMGEACLCERFETKGFDYGENHSRMGKAGAGKRWLTPRDRKALGRDK